MRVELLFAAVSVLLVQIIPQECRCLPADAAVLPRPRILHQGTERCAVIVAVCALRPETLLMRNQHRSVISQDIHLVGINANEHLLVTVLRPGGVIMLPAQADLPIAVCLEPFIAADGECLPWQRSQCGTVFFEKRSNADAFLVMRLLRFHVVPLQELAVVDMEIFDSRDGDEEIGADIANFALYVALLIPA